MNIGEHVSFSIMVSLGYMPGSGIAGSYGSFTPSFLRNLHSLVDQLVKNLPVMQENWV